jgi:hypothetical protein
VATLTKQNEVSGVQPDTPSGVIGLVRLLAKAAAREAVVGLEHGDPSDRDHPSEDIDEADY